MPRLIILDFDGTFTNAEEEGKPFTDGCIGDLSTKTGIPIEQVREVWTECAGEISANPAAHPYMRNGYAVVPANADPYLRMGEIVRMTYERFGIVPVAQTITDVVDEFFKANYGNEHPVFKSDALNVLFMLAYKPVHVVTNSATDKVSAKIETLGRRDGAPNLLDPLLRRVHGLAQKFSIDPTFTAVPESMELHGLDRPVLLRRKHYFGVLNSIREAHGVEWSNVIVVGDIFELDLALPLALGAKVVLVPNENTPDYERAFVAAHERGHVVHNLRDIPALILD